MSTTSRRPLRLGLAGVSHDHVSIIDQISPEDFYLVGVWERDTDLLAGFGVTRNISADRLYADIGDMLRDARPDCVAAFGSIYDHLAVVEACAPLGVHVMVEKPLAVSLDHAGRIAELAREHGIHVLTNYETTWYASNQAAFEALAAGRIGTLRKVLVRDGHFGPVESGCRPEFLSWLMDPAKSGGGALSDFGCYGANLMTFMMAGRPPNTVTATVRTFKPQLYGEVDDDALIALGYDDAEAVIQASWAWPVPRKDLELYGTSGYLLAPDPLALQLRSSTDAEATAIEPAPLPPARADPFSYFAAVVRGDIVPAPYDLSSLANNLVVVRILDAARRSATTGKTIALTSGQGVL